MEVRYQCTADDYVEAQRAHARKSSGYYVLLVLGILSVLTGLTIMLRVSLGSGLVVAFGGIFWLSWFPLFLSRWRIKRDFRKHPNLGVPCALVADGDGLKTQSNVTQSQSAWRAYSKFLESPNLFLIYPGARMFFMVPKRAFSSVELEEFRRLLHQNLQRK
jgi:hypothetical protein